MQVAHLVADAYSQRASLEARRVPAGMARSGRVSLPESDTRAIEFCAGRKRMVLRGDQARAGTVDHIRSRAIGSGPASVLDWLGRHDRHRADAALRVVPSALVRLAQSRR